jgi:AcrR family transcriptional regulator
MKIPRSDAIKTRNKLLLTASKVFAEKGFRGATFAEICKRAGCNVMAINYHFGSKANLYQEAWRYLFEESLKAHPHDGGVPETAAPEERLRGQITSLLLRLTDKTNQAHAFLYREYANPTGLLKSIGVEFKPMQERTKQAIRDILGPCPDERDVNFCEMAIISQCQNPMVVYGRLGGQHSEGKGVLQVLADVEDYARRVVEFSLAGLTAVRRRAEAPQTRVGDNISR